MSDNSAFLDKAQVRVGLVGTGYAAKLRAEALLDDSRADLVAVVGNQPQRTLAFAQDYQCQGMSSWQDLVEREDVDLVVISTMNRDHGAIARGALKAGKHVVVEYPLAVDVAEAEEIIALAKTENKLLHVEHIELLGGVHQALKSHLPEIGEIFYTRYNTIKPQLPAPRKWTYNHDLFGFPLIGALSRLHRLVDLFGQVEAVNCHNRFWQTEEEFYQSCLCVAQLSFDSGLLGQVIYGKGETMWQAERRFEVHGESGAIVVDGNAGILIQTGQTTPVDVGSRRGLFAKDTAMVLDCLLLGSPLYVSPEDSLYTLKVADAAWRSAQSGLTAVVRGYSSSQDS